MALKKPNKQDGSFARSFKPAKILGAVTLPEMLNRVFLKQEQELFDKVGNQLLYVNTGYDGMVDNPEASKRYILETENPLVNPIIREVTVKGMEDFTYSYVFEGEENSFGITLVLFKELSDKGQVLCNVRLLPFSKLSDIINPKSNGSIQVTLPRVNVIKLNVILKSSNTGEVLYKTHKTQVILENTTEQEIARMDNILEFQIASKVAHFTNMLLDVNPDENSPGNYSIALRGKGKKVAKYIFLGVAVISGSTAIILYGLSGRFPHNPWFGAAAHMFSAFGAIAGIINRNLDTPATVPAAVLSPETAQRQRGYRQLSSSSSGEFVFDPNDNNTNELVFNLSDSC